MVNVVVNALISGILGAIAIYVAWSITDTLSGSVTDPLLLVLIPLIPISIGIVTIVGMFMLLTKIQQV
jgi:hypothetical protein